MAYIDDSSLSQDDAVFINRVKIALVSLAIDVQAESTATASHAARSAFALQILNNPLGYAQRMAPGFAADGATVTGSTDAQIKTRGSSIFNAYCVQG